MTGSNKIQISQETPLNEKDYKPLLFQGSVRENSLYITLFVVATLGGVIRKWVTTSNLVSNGVLFVEMIIFFLMFFYRSGNAVSPFRKFTILNLFFFFLVVEVFNPLQVTIFHGILGIIIYGGFWLALFFYFSNRELFRPTKYIKFILVIAILEMVLGIIQYGLPANNVLNRYSDAEKSIAMVGDRVRITGTFSYLSGFTAFLIFYMFFLWTIIRLKFNSWIITVATVFGIVASFMSGSRSTTLVYLVFTVPVFIKEYPPSELARFVVRMIIPAAVVFSSLLIIKNVPLLDTIEKAYDNFFGRVKAGRESGEEASRLSWDLFYIENSTFKYPIAGIGTGATYQGAIILFGRSPYELEFGYVEGENIKIILEGGIVLVIFKIILVTTLVLNLSFSSRFFRFLIWLILMFLVPFVFNIHNAVFIFLGIVMIDNVFWRQQIERPKIEQDLLVQRTKEILNTQALIR